MSYEQTQTANRDTTIGIVPYGYANDMTRPASGRFKISINGTRYPQMGRVCMDQFVVDLGPDTDIEVGDTAIIVGDPTPGKPDLDDLTKTSGVINCEVLTVPKRRSERKWVRSRIASTAKNTRDLGEEIGRELAAGDLVILDGPLGANKTTLTQGIIRGMNMHGRVTSLMFTTTREHRPLATDGITLIHVDTYRLFGEEEPGSNGEAFDALDSLDLDVDLKDGVVVAGWGMGPAEILSERCLQVSISRSRDDDARVVT